VQDFPVSYITECHMINLLYERYMRSAGTYERSAFFKTAKSLVQHFFVFISSQF